jgi:hypothetical protein
MRILHWGGKGLHRDIIHTAICWRIPPCLHYAIIAILLGIKKARRKMGGDHNKGHLNNPTQIKELITCLCAMQRLSFVYVLIIRTQS